LNARYRYTLAKYVRNAPTIEKFRWCTYAALTISFIPITVLFVDRIVAPLYAWLLISAVIYFDVVHQYWNGKTFRISLAYAFVAYVWRLLRSIALIFL
jgi:hypothetical protein